ncbi:MAG: sigma-70 family RNA polymerase sigma factor [Odoribacteraceae bacterium]|jgi:RNA polymerase sigma factor (sigma-70 family)|nr:sigma-70 family RNA polymerase sigma factor [Odoribacteraceae bacterium]
MTDDTRRPASRRVTEIYRQHRPWLERFISRRVKLQEEVEDILQDVFYHLARLDPMEYPIENVPAWLRAVTRNRLVDSDRKHRETRLPATRQDGEWIEEITTILAASDTETPLARLLRALFWEELHRALAELPPEQRAIFELTEIENIPFKQIADTTGIPTGTLLARKHRAVLHLRERLERLYREMLEP